MKVLIVDDSSTMRKIISAALNDKGDFTLETAVDGADAESKVLSFQPDLILLDWNMPNVSGIDFLKKYRASGATTPVIMVTTEAEKPRVIEAIKAGANNYCIKPFTPEDLLKRIGDTMAAKSKAA